MNNINILEQLTAAVEQAGVRLNKNLSIFQSFNLSRALSHPHTRARERRTLPPEAKVKKRHCPVSPIIHGRPFCNKLMSIVYGRKLNYPCLQTFIIAPPASGKGVLTWVRHLAADKSRPWRI